MDTIFNYEDRDGDEVVVSASARDLEIQTHGENNHVSVPVAEAVKLRDALNAFIDNHSPRSYVVGLPVVITVQPDGQVEYEVDTAEAAIAVHSERYIEDENKTIDRLDLDVEAIQRDHDRRRDESVSK